MPAKKTSRTAASTSGTAGFSSEEREAMKSRVRELKNAKRGADGENDVLSVIARTAEPERTLCQRLHVIIRDAAPGLSPKTWYGLPAYANADGKVVVFFKPASKFKDRYLTLGFNDTAKLDDGTMWPTSFAVTRLTAAGEKRIRALVKQATG